MLAIYQFVAFLPISFGCWTNLSNIHYHSLSLL